MSNTANPFARGFQNLRVIRTLCVSYEDGSPLVWRSIHASQTHLSDGDLSQSPCLVSDSFALVTGFQKIDDDLASQCNSGEGVVRGVVYAIYGDEFDGHPVHVGDVYSAESAREIVQRLSFETGVYSRSWEISATHLTQKAIDYLMELADIATPEGFLFIAFRVPYSPAIGVKLISTPWTDENLQELDGITAEQLRQEHQNKGMPESLMNALNLAAEADVRILIFDADAPVLEGLPVYET